MIVCIYIKRCNYFKVQSVLYFCLVGLDYPPLKATAFVYCYRR